MNTPKIDPNKVKKTKERIEFESRENPLNLEWFTVRNRLVKGESIEQAMSYPLKHQKIKDKINSYPNPFNLPLNTIKSRLRKGESIEQAMSYPSKTKSKERAMFENHENPFNLSWDTVKFRLSKRIDFESAMNEPSGTGYVGKFKNGWVMLEGEWTNVDNLEMIFDKETTENMIKSGVKVEKLFTKRKG